MGTIVWCTFSGKFIQEHNAIMDIWCNFVLSLISPDCHADLYMKERNLEKKIKKKQKIN